MNDDLISRSALLKAMEEERQYLLARGLKGAEHILVHHCLPLIDNAPAVEPEKAKESELIKAYTKGFDTGVETVKNERPQGKWVRAVNKTKRSYQRMCDNCHNIVYFCGKGNYPNCPYCLADMKGGAK